MMRLLCGLVFSSLPLGLAIPIPTQELITTNTFSEERQLDGFPFTAIAAVVAALTDTAAIDLLGAPRVAGGPADPLDLLQTILARENKDDKRQILNDLSNPTLLLTDVTAAATDEPAVKVPGAQPVAGGASNLGILLGASNEKRQILQDLGNPTLLLSDVLAAATDGLALKVLGGKPVAGGGSNLGNLFYSRDGQSSFLIQEKGLASQDAIRMLSPVDQSTDPFTEASTFTTQPNPLTTDGNLIADSPADPQSFISSRELGHIPSVIAGLSSEFTDPVANAINDRLSADNQGFIKSRQPEQISSVVAGVSSELTDPAANVINNGL